MNYKAVIFDLDGTLANTIEDIANACNYALESLSLPTHTIEQYRQMVGGGLQNLVERALPDSEKQNTTLASQCFERLFAYYDIHYLEQTQLYPAIPELLNELANLPIKLAVLSNKADSLTQKITAELLKPWHFDLILGQTDRFPKKPDPTAALYIAEQLNVLPQQVCYVGDSAVDMKTANAAGFFSVGVEWGFRSRQELIQHYPNALIAHPSQLLNLL